MYVSLCHVCMYEYVCASVRMYIVQVMYAYVYIYIYMLCMYVWMDECLHEYTHRGMYTTQFFGRDSIIIIIIIIIMFTTNEEIRTLRQTRTNAMRPFTRMFIQLSLTSFFLSTLTYKSSTNNGS